MNRIQVVDGRIEDMSIGRIELVDGKKQYVRYATLGGV